MRGARVGARRHVHAHVAGGSGKHAAGNERQRHERAEYRHDAHYDSNHQHEDDEQLVLAHEERLRALLDLDRNAVHLVGAGILLNHPAPEVGGYQNADECANWSHPCYRSSHVHPPYVWDQCALPFSSRAIARERQPLYCRLFGYENGPKVKPIGGRPRLAGDARREDAIGAHHVGSRIEPVNGFQAVRHDDRDQLVRRKRRRRFFDRARA